MKKIYQNITLILILFVLGTIHIQAQHLSPISAIEDSGHDEFLLGNPVAVIKPKRPTPCDCKHLGNLDFTYSRSLNIALANDRRIIAAEREKAIKWYNKQTKLLHGFLNSFTGYSPTYTEARNKLFKASEQTNINIHRPTVARKFQSLDYNANDAKRKGLYGLKALQQRAREIRDGNINNSLYADIVVNGIALKNIKTIAAVTKESKKINSNNILRNKLWQAHRYKFLHDLVKSNNHRFLEVVKQEAARRKNGIHNGYNVWDKLNYMQLLIHNERIKRHGVLQVPYSPQQAITFQKFKNKVDVVTAQLIEELAKKQYTGNKMSVTHPEYWKVIWKQKYNNNIFKKVAAVEEYVRLANEACNKAINSTSVGSNLSVDYLVNQLKITDKNQYAWLNANPQKAIVYEKQIKNYVKGSASSEFGNTLGGNLNLSNGNNLLTDPTNSIKSDIVNGGLVQAMINDLGINNFYQKQYLYENPTEANRLRILAAQNTRNNSISPEAQNYIKGQAELGGIERELTFKFKQKSGKLNNRADQEYTHIAHSGNYTMYKMKDGSTVLESPNLLTLDKNGRFNFFHNTQPSDYKFHYIRLPEEKQWSRYLLKYPNSTKDELATLFELGVIEGSITIARYVLPIEDIKILIDGKDFDGQKVSRIRASALILLSAVPGGKGLAVTSRIAINATRWGKFILVNGKRIKYSHKLVNNVVEFGTYNSSKFRKILDIAGDATRQAHHVLSRNLRTHRAIQKAAKSKTNPFHIDEFLNGIPVLTWRNQPNHNIYDANIRRLLDDIPANLSPEKTFDELKSIIERVKRVIRENPNTHLNGLIF